MASRQFFRIEGDAVSLVQETVQRTVSLADLLAEAAKESGVTTPILPSGCRFFHAQGNRSVFVIEQVPQTHQVNWSGMGEGDKWKLAFPFVVFVLSFAGEAVDTAACRVFYRTAPLGGTDDPVLRPNLCNTYQDGRICTGSIRVSGTTLAQKAESFVAEFWRSHFNGDLQDNNWRPAAKQFPQVASLTAWQEESAKNPLFPLGIKWFEAEVRLSDVIAGRC
ncbi:MAG: hypothetical protein KBD19_03165 [Candidatus Moranbacteria bacterium]|nr:hypothetical protein [Candidatus Moranbacteria bacterium]